MAFVIVFKGLRQRLEFFERVLPSMIRESLKSFAVACGLAAVSLLAACGGSKSVSPFVPERVVALGDETSAVPANGRRYTVNVLKDDGSVDCAVNPIWLQSVASNLGLPVGTCAGTATSAPSLSLATAAATVDSLTSQVETLRASTQLKDKDVVSFAVGMHDVLAAYEAVTAEGETAVTARLQAKGKQLGAQVNQMAQSGPAVLAFTVYDLSVTPFGRAEETRVPGRGPLLKRLTSAFNIAMRLEIINDGRLIGLVDTFDLINAMVANPGFFIITNTIDAPCSVPTPACDNRTIVLKDGVAVAWQSHLWADSLRLGPTAHARVGQIAEARARGNPF
jgi:outer membrane lipase/esterase